MSGQHRAGLAEVRRWLEKGAKYWILDFYYGRALIEMCDRAIRCARDEFTVAWWFDRASSAAVQQNERLASHIDHLHSDAAKARVFKRRAERAVANGVIKS
jgi:hypothetical protein